MKKGAKYLLSILVYSIILYTIAIINSNIINCEIKNILFIEGIIIVMIGIFSGIEGDSKGASLQGLGQNNTQYISNANLEVSKLIKQSKVGNFYYNYNTISLIISGIIMILISLV